MTVAIAALVAGAMHVAAPQRAAFAASVRDLRIPGTVLVETCHRVELYGTSQALRDVPVDMPHRASQLDGEAVVEHLIGVAVGLRSVVLAEDQILHQVRRGVTAARALGPLPAELDRLFDTALRAGRRARTFLPTPRPNLADLAVDVARDERPVGRVLVVGAGEMGRLALGAVTARGGEPVLTSRTALHAAELARRTGAATCAWDPGPEVDDFDGIVIALSGRWPIAHGTAAAMLRSHAWVADLSSPPALPDGLADALGPRLTTVDALAAGAAPRPSAALFGRLHELARASREEYLAWAATHGRRVAARALAEHADTARCRELEDLWRRVPTLNDEERDEVERMARHLTERLLATPLDRLGNDVDGRHEQAARELFRL